jgi:hypothetical protein
MSLKLTLICIVNFAGNSYAVVKIEHSSPFRTDIELKFRKECPQTSGPKNIGFQTLFLNPELQYIQENRHYKFVSETAFVLTLGCLRNFVSSKFRIFRMFFFISYTIRKWQQFRENNRNFALTGVRIDSVQIYQFSIAKIMTFFLDTSVNVV